MNRKQLFIAAFGVLLLAIVFTVSVIASKGNSQTLKYGSVEFSVPKNWEIVELPVGACYKDLKEVVYLEIEVPANQQPVICTGDLLPPGEGRNLRLVVSPYGSWPYKNLDKSVEVGSLDGFLVPSREDGGYSAAVPSSNVVFSFYGSDTSLRTKIMDSIRSSS